MSFLRGCGSGDETDWPGVVINSKARRIDSTTSVREDAEELEEGEEEEEEEDVFPSPSSPLHASSSSNASSAGSVPSSSTRRGAEAASIDTVLPVSTASPSYITDCSRRILSLCVRSGEDEDVDANEDEEDEDNVSAQGFQTGSDLIASVCFVSSRSTTPSVCSCFTTKPSSPPATPEAGPDADVDVDVCDRVTLEKVCAPLLLLLSQVTVDADVDVDAVVSAAVVTLADLPKRM